MTRCAGAVAEHGSEDALAVLQQRRRQDGPGAGRASVGPHPGKGAAPERSLAPQHAHGQASLGAAFFCTEKPSFAHLPHQGQALDRYAKLNSLWLGAAQMPFVQAVDIEVITPV